MIIKNDKNYRDDFVSIVDFIKEYEDGKPIDMYDLMNFISSFEYYKVFYQNYHIFKDLITYHDSHLGKKEPDKHYEDNKSLDELLRF